MLSIVIPSYNYAHFLSESIESVLDQNFRDFELLIIDDGSTDNSRDIILHFAKRDPRVRWIFHKCNQGLFPTVEEALKETRGIFLQFFSADDLYLPGFLSSAMQLFEQNPSLSLCCSDFFYLEGSKKREIKLLNNQNPEIFPPEKLLKLFQTSSFWIPGVSAVVKKEAFIRHGGLLSTLENISDWYVYHKIALLEGIGYIPQSLISMRLHKNTYTATVKRDKNRKVATYWRLLRHLSSNEDRKVKELFKRSSLLTFIFEQLFWKLIFMPRYWPYYRWLRAKGENQRKIRGALIKLARISHPFMTAD